jgi:hypothetical protein
MPGQGESCCTQAAGTNLGLHMREKPTSRRSNVTNVSHRLPRPAERRPQRYVLYLETARETFGVEQNQQCYETHLGSGCTLVLRSNYSTPAYNSNHRDNEFL